MNAAIIRYEIAHYQINGFVKIKMQTKHLCLIYDVVVANADLNTKTNEQKS